MSRWLHLKHVLEVISTRIDDKRLGEEERKFLQDIYKRLLWHEIDVEDAIIEAEMLGLRNPSFPDDLIGWLDDDFDEDDEDDEETEE